MLLTFQRLKTFQEALSLARVRGFAVKQEKNLLCYKKFEEAKQDRRKEGGSKSNRCIQHTTKQGCGSGSPN